MCRNLLIILADDRFVFFKTKQLRLRYTYNIRASHWLFKCNFEISSPINWFRTACDHYIICIFVKNRFFLYAYNVGSFYFIQQSSIKWRCISIINQINAYPIKRRWRNKVFIYIIIITIISRILINIWLSHFKGKINFNL